MVTLTPAAVAMLERFSADPDINWFVTIRWRKGAGDNLRGPDGNVVWDIDPTREWVAELSGWDKDKELAGVGMPLCGSVRLVVQNFFAPEPFPGGELYVENDQLRVRANDI